MLNSITGKRERFTSLFSLIKNLLQLIRYYWGLSRSNSSGSFQPSKFENNPKNKKYLNNLNSGKIENKQLFEFDSGDEGIHAKNQDFTISRIDTESEVNSTRFMKNEGVNPYSK